MEIQLHDSYFVLEPVTLTILVLSTTFLLTFSIMKFSRKIRSRWIDIGLVTSAVALVITIWWLATMLTIFLEISKANLD